MPSSIYEGITFIEGRLPSLCDTTRRPRFSRFRHKKRSQAGPKWCHRWPVAFLRSLTLANSLLFSCWISVCSDAPIWRHWAVVRKTSQISSKLIFSCVVFPHLHAFSRLFKYNFRSWNSSNLLPPVGKTKIYATIRLDLRPSSARTLEISRREQLPSVAGKTRPDVKLLPESFSMANNSFPIRTNSFYGGYS